MKSALSPRVLGLLLLAVGLLSSCGDSSGTGPPEEEPTGPANMVVAPETITVDALGQEIPFSATVWDQLGRELPDATVTWYTSDEKIATVTPNGLATTVGDGTVTILAAAANSVFGWGEMTVTAKPLAILTSILAPGVVGLPYSRTLEAEGSDSPTWTILDGALPVGLTLNQSTGEISGNPTQEGLGGFTVMLSGAGQAVTRAFVLVIMEEFLGVGFDEDQFALVSAGTFQMGSEEGWFERPVHTVNITRPFLMQKTEVTQYQWRAVVGTESSYFSNCGDLCPVERTSWSDVQTFLDALNAMDPGKNYRLPTEAEWEYAARAGTTGNYGGTEVLEEMGWYTLNSGGTPQIVGRKEPNAWGLYDMHGNVAEWVQDWYAADYYALSPSDDPPGPAGGTRRINRGGSAGSAAGRVTSWSRSFKDPLGGDPYLGFRLVRDP